MSYQATIRLPLPQGVDLETLEVVARAATLPWPWQLSGINFKSSKEGDIVEFVIESMDKAPPTEADLKALEERVPDAFEEAFNKHLEAFSKFKVAVSVCKERLGQKLQKFAQQHGQKSKKGGK